MLSIALPNKGRLAQGAVALLESAGLAFEARGERALQASLGADFRALFISARDIPEFVADGAADLGITGRDLVAEADRPLEVLLDLGYGRCRLVAAAREESPWRTLADLPDGTRVATAFPRLAERLLAAAGRRVVVVPVSGAAEVAPHLGVADLIVDLVATGSTLKVNGLRELATLLDSSALLVARPAALGASGPGERIGQLRTALESVLNARDQRYLMANVPRARLREVRQILPGLSGPTVVEVQNSGAHVAAHAVVAAADIYRVIGQLKALGATGILVTKIERLMP